MTKLIWLDLETTGLDPQRDYILEIAVATSTLDDPFNLTHVYQRVLGVGSRALRRMNDFVTEMHTKNGLLVDVAKEAKLDRSLDSYIYENELCDLVQQTEPNEEKPILAGSTVHFDRGFLKNYWPRFESYLHHRHYDVSSIKLFCQSLGMPPIPKGEVHRAQADIIESAEHAQLCQDWLQTAFSCGSAQGGRGRA